MTDAEKCDVCGQRVRVEGNTTRYCVGLEAERIKQLESENLLMREALSLVATPKRTDRTYNRCREACELIAKNALSKCQNTIQLQKERDADLAVIDAANKLNITRTGYGYRTDCNDTYAVRDLFEALANREKIYGERK